MKNPVQEKRRQQIEQYVPAGSRARENGYEPETAIGRYLAIDYGDEDQVRAITSDTWAALAQEMDRSDTSSTHVSIWDLDTQIEYVPIRRTIGFFAYRNPDNKVMLETPVPVATPSRPA